ncbi:hypothetical protein SFOMI_3004 [Sphingobium fuliginis]|uniref:Uncharacterized protein n=1 Tax=Sphingobium fuliginis (strain ATCC 27551) TaxID=336203 RepID=A0A292ZG72_SPHSA|nr:hypothetical protein SFOMI_3004 [Sphingobium fuliginis]
MVAPVALGADRGGEPVLLPAPGDQITKSHDVISYDDCPARTGFSRRWN